MGVVEDIPLEGEDIVVGKDIAVVAKGMSKRHTCVEQDILVLGELFSLSQQDGEDSVREAEGVKEGHSSQDGECSGRDERQDGERAGVKR